MQVYPSSTLHDDEQPSWSFRLPSSQSSPVSRLPFPQLVAHSWVDPVPFVPRQMGSLVQVFEQPVPSPLNRPFGPVQPVGMVLGSLPQSQDSPVSLIPFPHFATLQSLPGVGQSAPGSTWQVTEQPSPLRVLPSSHASLPSSLLSPQIGVQGFPGTRHCHPGSMVWQSAEQPSTVPLGEPTVFPSSQVSSEVSTLLPHSLRSLQGSLGSGQMKLAMIWQRALQPVCRMGSLGFRVGSSLRVGGMPSSQSSPLSSTPFPQVLDTDHVLGGPDVPPAPVLPPEPLQL